MKKFRYKCLDCGYEGVDNRDGIRCPNCKGYIVPTGDVRKEKSKMTNREAHEKAAGMALDNMFFRMNGIDPNAEYQNDIYVGVNFADDKTSEPDIKLYAFGSHIPKMCYETYGEDLDGCSTQQSEGCSRCVLYRNKVEQNPK